MTEGAGTIEDTEMKTDATGFATARNWSLGRRPGRNTVAVMVEGLEKESGAIRFEVTTPRIERHSAVTQNTAAGCRVDDPPKVRVLDRNGDPVPGIDVTFTVVRGGGSVSPNPVQTTDADGFASVEWTLGPTPGRNRLTVTVADPEFGGHSAEFCR